MSLQDTLTLGRVLAESKRFADDTNAEQAVVKVLAGRELGFGPIASMTGIYVIKGKVSVSANMMAQAVKRSAKYDYRIVEMTATRCEIAFFEGVQELGRSEFTLDDARKAGTQNLDKYPRNMLFARAMSNGVKWYCPDVFQTGVYTPEELGAPVDGDGDLIIDVTPTQPKSTETETKLPHITPEPPAELTAEFIQNYPAPEDWRELYTVAALAIGYKHKEHAVNVIEQMLDKDQRTVQNSWAVLVDHQLSKFAKTETSPAEVTQ